MQQEQQRYEKEEYVRESAPAPVPVQMQAKEETPIKKKIVRQYDANGNVVSEKEVPVN